MKNLNWLIFISGLSLSLLYGCMEDSLGVQSGAESDFTLNYSIADMVGSQALSTSRADVISTPDERKVNKILMLFFESKLDNSGAFVGSCNPTVANELPDGWELAHTTLSKEELPVTLSPDKEYRVWVIANYEENGLSQTDLLEKASTMTEAELRETLTVGNSVELVSPFLMSASTLISGKDKTCTVALQRNVAKIEVVNAIPDEKFVLKSIELGNMRESSYVMDLDGDFPIKYSLLMGNRVSATTSVGATSLSTYAFETFKEKVESADDGTLCVIIGGEMQGLLKYYRVNINVRGADALKSQRIKRNAKYTIVLTDINGWGVDTPGEALNTSSDLVLISETGFWDELFDGIYTYGSHGKGFAPSTNAIKGRFLTLISTPEQPTIPGTEFTVDVYWANRGISMAAPSSGELAVVSSDEQIVTVTKESAARFSCQLVGFGSASISLTYDGVIRKIPVEVSPFLNSSLTLNSVVIAPYNLGGTKDHPAGTLFSASDLADACPTGWRLPTEVELTDLTTSNALLVTENGFLAKDPASNEPYATYFPFAGKESGGATSEVGEVAYYWTGSSGGNGSTRKVFKGEKTGGLTTVGVSTPSTEKYSVRCVATVDDKPFGFVNQDGVTYEVKNIGGISSNANWTKKCGDLGAEWKRSAEYANDGTGLAVLRAILETGAASITALAEGGGYWRNATANTDQGNALLYHYNDAFEAKVKAWGTSGYSAFCMRVKPEELP